MEKHRVVITGIGVVTPIGVGIVPFWENAIKGKCGVGSVTHFDTSNVTCRVAGEVLDYDATQFMDPKEVKRSDRYTQFAMGAAKLAVVDAKVAIDSLDKERFGVIIGSGIGGMETIEQQSRTLYEKGARRVSPFMIPSLIGNIAAGIVAIEMGARGPNYGIVTACATGSHAVGSAYETIAYGKADVMIAGGSEASITELGFSGFCSMKAMSTAFNDQPQKSSRPFDLKRDGFVMGEGAGVLLLETLEHAQKRGAHIYAEIVGYGASCDAYHITSPDPEGKGVAAAMRSALKEAALQPSDVDYINAHGTSTPYNDKFETLAIKNVFGDYARKVKISSTKSMTGHLLGAAGVVESAVCIKAIETGIIPPTINYEFPDPDCDLDYTPNTAVKHRVNVALNNNLGFGGQNAAIVFKKYT
ncbi:MAG: beta-ketoacyl-[acyl-carrier-protein] synthase II [Verrucomicrobia bacterium GWF2_51_19]|nr:MAG: beta-ketoacyl-[acyl-carrier-protein] synthase II [Verrucomicrobia bacterium GWF2_51_19]HCJ12003.1 beta-ketoacyl-[acyl-carrier-protein] synthase II [Opitutae bacterium]